MLPPHCREAAFGGNLSVAAKYLRSHATARKPRATPRRIEPTEPEPEYSITPAYLFSVLNRVMPRKECPSSKGDFDRYLMLDESGSFYSVPNGILGFGLPVAVGLQMAHSDRRVVCHWRWFHPVFDPNALDRHTAQPSRRHPRAAKCGLFCIESLLRLHPGWPQRCRNGFARHRCLHSHKACTSRSWSPSVIPRLVGLHASTREKAV